MNNLVVNEILKYPKKMYLDSGFYAEGMDEEIENSQEKIAKCRKPHNCVGGCETEIQAGEHALCESGFMGGRPVSCYTCITCIEAWLEESGQVDVEEDEKEQSTGGTNDL